MILSARNILIYLAVIYNGDFEMILQAVHEKVKVDEEKVKNVIDKITCGTLTILDEDYPEYLRNIYKPPFVLFYEGDIGLIKNIKKNLAVVGSRKATKYGLNSTSYLIKGLKGKYNIVSGLAYGIDYEAHLSALASNAPTIAVMAHGIDICYPPEHSEVYEIIKKKGLVISEYPLGVEPSQDNFRFRNRIVAGLSKCVLVTEAYGKSGTSITVTYALDQGKEVLCVPYPILKGSECNRLIKCGANIVIGPDDIVELME